VYKIAFLNIECFGCSAAVERIMEEHRDQIRLVVASNPDKPQHGGIISETRKHFVRSGFLFNHYLALNFLYHPLALTIVGLLNRLPGVRLRRRSLKRSCELAGVPYVMTADVNSPEILALLREHDIDLIVSFYYDQILKSEIISIPEHGVINFHPGILPDCRGLFPVIFSALRNNGVFGMTAHDIQDETIDTGPILAQTILEIPDTRSILKLDLAVTHAGVKLFREVIRNLPQLRRRSQSQTGGNYYSYPTRSDLHELKTLGYYLTSTKDFVVHYCEREAQEET